MSFYRLIQNFSFFKFFGYNENTTHSTIQSRMLSQAICESSGMSAEFFEFSEYNRTTPRNGCLHHIYIIFV